MGADIHIYLDYDKFINGKGEFFVENVAMIHISRDYLLFAIMANVRNRDGSIKPISKPKGLPSRVSYTVESNYTLWVVDEGENIEEGCCDRKSAEKWAKNKGWWDETKNRVNHPDWHSTSWLDVKELEKVQEIYSTTIRDYPYTKIIKPGDKVPEGYKISEQFSWCNTEKETIIEEIEPGLMGKHEVLEGIISMMKVLNNGDISKTRLVFWFDN